MCDHTIAYMNEFITQSEIKKVVGDTCREWNTHGETMASLTGSTKRYKSDRNPADFLDRRRSYMTMFNNCPFCGEKINWREIKKAI